MCYSIPRKVAVALIILCVLFSAALTSWAAEDEILQPDGMFEGEAGATLSLHYLGNGAVEVKLQSSNCFYEEPGITTYTWGPHLLHSFHNQAGLLLVIFYEKDYAVVSAEMPGFAAKFCTHGISDATGYYPRIK